MDIIRQDVSFLAWSLNFSFLDIFPGLINSGVGGYWGLKLFAGILALLLTITFLLNKEFPRRKRLAGAIFLLIMLFSMQVNKFNLVWHLLNEPYGYPYRQSFVFSFLMLIFAVQAFGYIGTKMKFLKPFHKSVLIVLTVLLLYNSFMQNTLTADAFILNLVLLLTWAILLSLFSAYKTKKIGIILCCLMLLVMSFDLFAHTSNSYKAFHFRSREEIRQKQSDIALILDDIRDKDKGLFRVGDTNALTPNDGFLYNYMSSTISSSTENLAVLRFLHSLGYANNRNDYRVYYTHNIITDALFGIKYITPVNENNLAYPVHKVSGGGDYQENPYALPLLFVSPGSFELTLEGDALENQKSLFSSIIPQKKCLYLLENLSKSIPVYEFCCVTNGPVYFDAPDGKYSMEYKINESEFATIDFPVPISNRIAEPWRNETETIPCLLGFAEEGDILTLRIAEPINERAAVMQVDMSEFSVLCKNIQNKTIEISRLSSQKLAATVIAEENDLLFISIPYSVGWKLYIDGKETEIKQALSVFMGVELTPGRHTVTLIYNTPGFFVGKVISFVSLLIFIAVFIVTRRRTSHLVPSASHTKFFV
jgi:uncharacterized membrane protein YfhO